MALSKNGTFENGGQRIRHDLAAKSLIFGELKSLATSQSRKAPEIPGFFVKVAQSLQISEWVADDPVWTEPVCAFKFPSIMGK